MDNINKEILRSVRYARDRMHSSLIIDTTAKSLFAALGIYLVLAFLARFFPIYNPYGKGTVLIAIISAAGFVISLFMPPKNESAALLLDRKGLAERTITAYELIDDDSDMALMQKRDTMKHLKSINIKKEIKIVLPKKILAFCFLLTILILLSAFIPNPMEEKAIELNNVKKKIESQEKEVEKIIKKVESNNKISMEQKKEALEKLSELKKEIGQAKDLNQAQKAIQRTENKIDMMKQKYNDKDMEKMIDVFSKNQATKNLADALENGDSDKIKKDILDTAKALQNLDSDDIKKLSESFGELSKALKSNPELASAIMNLAQKMADGELGDMQYELDALRDELEKLMQNEEFKKAMDDVIKQLNCGECQNPGSQSQGQGQGQGSGTGSGSGVGAGSGSGSGSGAGSGSGGGKDGVNEGTSYGLGKKETTGGEIKEYEKVFAPRLLGGEGDKDFLQGHKNQEGQTKLYEIEQGMTIKGEMVPYNQVLGQYKDKVFQNIEGSQIPQGMQNIVKEYFSSLED